MKVGSKVICIDNKIPPGKDNVDKLLFKSANLPEVGQCYTVREIDDSYVNTNASIRLEEIHNLSSNALAAKIGIKRRYINGDKEIAFSIRRFAEVSDDFNSDTIEEVEPEHVTGCPKYL